MEFGGRYTHITRIILNEHPSIFVAEGPTIELVHSSKSHKYGTQKPIDVHRWKRLAQQTCGFEIPAFVAYVLLNKPCVRSVFQDIPT